MTDTYFACCQITFVRRVSVCVTVCTPCMHGVRKDVYSTYCDLLSWLYLWIRPSMSIFYFIIPCACIAYSIATAHYTRSHALCVICVKHLAQAQHFKNKKS